MAIVLIIFFVVVLIWLLIEALISMAGSSVLSIKEFFFNTAWGIVAIIAGVLSLVFFYVSAKMPKRMRESKARVKAITPMLRYTASGKPVIKSNLNLPPSRMKKEEIQETVIDMEKMSLEGFFREVTFTLNKPSPVIFKAWGLRRMELDTDRIRQLGQYIESVRGTADQYLKLRADMFFSKEKFEHYVKTNRANSDNDLDLIQEKYKTAKHSEEYERRKKDADMKDREIEQEERLGKIKEQNARNEFFNMAIKEYPEMPAPLKAYMFTQVHGRYPEAKRDFDMEEKINDYIMKKYENEVANMDLETKQKKEEVKTQIDKLKHEREKKYQ